MNSPLCKVSGLVQGFEGRDSDTSEEVVFSTIAKLPPIDQHEAENEWKLAQSNLESASSGLVSATEDLIIVSVNSKSASGHSSYNEGLGLRSQVALSSYVGIVGGYSALPSECGSMLEDVSSIYMSMVIYRVFTSSNLLLDDKFKAKLSAARTTQL
ncbi:Protein kinase superfamily protein [Perilla frutescens var. frutescens]|nr:Protein kinase superfamily protein [Perilla frutescens var. frutescens]